MVVLSNLIVGILLQCIRISSHHIAHVKYIATLFAIYLKRKEACEMEVVDRVQNGLLPQREMKTLDHFLWTP